MLRYESFATNWLCSFDGTQFFTSTKIHCVRCSVKVQNGQTHYAHTAITPVLVAPGESRVITLEPEFITPQDQQEKQDCERNAAKRWLTRHRDRFGSHVVTYLGDDLYSNQPFCEQVRAGKQQHFVFTCKPDSHTTLYEEVALLNRLGAVSQVSDRHWTGRAHERWTYRYVNAVPLRAGADALLVSWCELTIIQEATGQLLSQNAWITDHVLSDQTVRPLVAAGRARWKIENENNNVLKNHGYHLQHNFGHGHHYLAQVLVLLNLLAFLMHTVLDLGDEAYQRIRRELGTRQTFFNDIQALTRYWFFANWQQLLDFMAAGLELRPAPT